MSLSHYSQVIFGHGVGSRSSLPLELWMLTWGAALVLGLSFVALGVLWKEPKLAKAAEGRAVATPPHPMALRVIRGIGQAAAVALFLVALWAGLFGVDDQSANILPVTLYVVVWVGITLLAGTLGDVWRAINPLATIARGASWLAQKVGVEPSTAPAHLGHWPAAAGLFVFLFYELAHPSGSQPRTLGYMLAVHMLVVIVLGIGWGADWIADHEPFSAIFDMISAMAPFGSDGRLRAPMSGLATMPVLPGTLAALMVVLGGTSFDGFAESEVGRSLFGNQEGWAGGLVLGIGLILSILLVGSLFGVGIRWTCSVTGRSPEEITDAFTPSLVPIVFGYAIAHYALLLIDEVQTFWFRLSDPGGQGWNLFGGADGSADLTLLDPNVVAWIQVLAILFGHIGAVAVAHDRSMEIAEHKDAQRSQYVMLLVMVAYSCLGLFLLFNA